MFIRIDKHVLVECRHRNICTRTLINASNFVVKDTRAHTRTHTFISSFHSSQRIYSDTSKKKKAFTN